MHPPTTSFHLPRRFCSWLLGAAWTLSLLALAHGGQAHFGSFPEWFSTQQAQEGQAIASVQCAGCHGGQLEGRYGPPLSGPRFISRWGGHSAKELQAYILERMPLGRAGTLSNEQVLVLVAYILQTNGYPAGHHPLQPEALEHIELLKP